MEVTLASAACAVTSSSSLSLSLPIARGCLGLSLQEETSLPSLKTLNSFFIGLVFIFISEKIDYFLLKIIKIILFIFCINMIYIDKADNQCFK